ncbi:DUF4239 domain-containing protein [Nonomuraea sp. NEAU-A123]|uniref:bestrophin-like domain n=1 Tax=Nonomuraea sp. NEAU-A123 TaxID=2839649 RepID=UPI001BE4CB20|nr:DUF4239 domain-containing protein [Nonomuraea sp. NEAU-A123]MBT2225666.1 DUF4239 domain-containing protein [Nonomuraea sp. NEAU-A123]
MLQYIIAAAAAVGVVAVAATLFRLAKKGSDDNDAGGPSAGHAGAMLSAMFLLVFAIAIIVPWTTADTAAQNTQTESQAAVEAYWSASGLPGTAPALVRAGLRDYITFIVKDEWPVMQRGAMDPVGTERLDALRARVDALQVTTDQKEARTAVLDHIAAIAAARAQRAADAGATPPDGLLALTIITGLLVVLFPFLAGARPRGLALLPVVAMAAMLGFGIYLTWDISHAFNGPLAVEPEAYKSALQEFARISGGV